MSSANVTTWNCTHYPNLQSNSDIGGIGLIVSFVATAYITFICCIAKARIDQIRSPSKTTPRLDIWSFALGNAILSFSDQQVITGISVIIGGVSQLNGGIDSYHWQTVANLAWFSAFTHMTTLTILRQDDRQNKKIRKLRVFAMGVLVVMLSCVMYSIGWLTGTFDVYDANLDYGGNLDDYEQVSMPLSFPAWCLYHPHLTWGSLQDGDNTIFHMKYDWVYVTLALFILIYTYSTRMLLLFFNSFSEIMQIMARLLRFNKLTPIISRLKIHKVKGIEPTLEGMNKSWVRYRLLRSFYALVLAIQALYASIVWEFTWLFTALMWGTVRILIVREDGTDSNEYTVYSTPGSDKHFHLPDGENTWAFGQVVSLVLLILPFLSFFEAYASPPEGDALMMKTHPESQTKPDGLKYQSLITSANDVLESSISNACTSQIQNGIREESWYKKLVVCIYILFLSILGIFTYVFAGGGFGIELMMDGDIFEAALYFLYLIGGLFLLWIATLILIDHDVQAAWRSIGRFFTRKSV